MNNPASEWDGIKVSSKGFFTQIVIQDFPIRGHNVFFHIRRRRWLNAENQNVIYRSWTLVFSSQRNANDRRFRCFFKRSSIIPEIK
ncbi:ISAon1 family transposase N-terminal region protein [Pedobacter hiemivivus]